MFTKLYKYIKENIFYFITYLILILCIVVKLPYTIYTTGGLINVNERLENVQYESSGSFNLTYVSSLEGRPLNLLLALILPSWDIIKNDDIKYSNEEIEDANKRDKIYNMEAISSALYNSYTKAGLDPKITDTHYYIIYKDTNSNSELKVGDELISYDNKDFDFDLFSNYINSLNEDSTITIKVKRDGKLIDTVSSFYRENDQNMIGIVIDRIYDYDNELSYQSKDNEYGSSGGLMLSLAMYNSLISEDITNGKTICGTGTISLDGVVGEIAGIKYKLKGAVKNKCDVFIVPHDNYEETIELVEKENYSIPIIEAYDFDQVLEDLKKTL